LTIGDVDTSITFAERIRLGGCTSTLTAGACTQTIAVNQNGRKHP
jgi:hypothetical protein